MSRLHSVFQLKVWSIATPSVLPNSWVWTLCSSISPENKSPVGWGWAVAWHIVLSLEYGLTIWNFEHSLGDSNVQPRLSINTAKSNKCQTNVSYLHSICLNNYLLIIFLHELSVSLKCYFKSKCPIISGNEKLYTCQDQPKCAKEQSNPPLTPLSLLHSTL